MISKSMICDKCGKEIECWANYIERESSARIKFWGVGATRSNDGQKIDLCSNCAEKFINWLETEVTENE